MFIILIGLVVRHIDLSSSAAALLSSSIGGGFLTCVVLMTKKKIPWNLVKSNFICLIFSGIALAGNWIFLYGSYQYTTVTNATLAYYFAPVIVMICSPIMLHEHLSVKKILCIFTAVIGMVMIVGTGLSAFGKQDLLGIFLGVIAAVFYASLMLVNKFIHDMDKLELTMIQLGTAAVLLFFYVFFTEGLAFLSVSKSALPFIALLGIVNTGIGFWLFFSGMQKLSGQSIAVLSYVDPLVAILISGVVLQERMTVVQVLGGILLLGSTFTSEVKSLHKPHKNIIA
ncbi:DMT family transporter [Sporolactobacillus nakayamae]|uniref:DMT family transporter n=1 Tax=Sporolactobacillus nakayamae TaxID=269670 RepID=UPI001FDF1B5A|nr:DMT family transporter [Sporolactobacillus nakayamae]